MKAIVSTTYDDKYFWYLPLTAWAWNKLGVDVICFAPMAIERSWCSNGELKKYELVLNTIKENDIKCRIEYFYAMPHKEATYAQCSRLYGAAIKDIPDYEFLVTGDIDMVVFKAPEGLLTDTLQVIGIDLVPHKQVPICYIFGSVMEWRRVFEIGDRKLQKCLDDLLGDVDSLSMRGDFWSRDQETAYNMLAKNSINGVIVGKSRTNGQNTFATLRYDRDDSYILERLSPDTIDYHMNRPGFTDENFAIILKVFQYHYPQENFDWLINYKNNYQRLL